MFGLTVTGYVFLINLLNNIVNNDDTLEDIMKILKIKYFNDIIFISIVAGISIFLCIFSINSMDMNWKNYNLLINMTLLFGFFQIAMILIFVITIIDPYKISKLSSKLKKEYEEANKEDANIIKVKVDFKEKISGSVKLRKSKANDDESDLEKGNIQGFLKKYNKIENIMREFCDKNYHSLQLKYNTNRLSNKVLTRALYENGAINHELFEELIELIKFRNYTVHSSEVHMDKKMFDKTEEILDQLKNQLNY